MPYCLTLTTLSMESKGFFQFQIILNVFVGSFPFIWIPMSWGSTGHVFSNYFSAGIVFRRQILRYVRFWCLETVPVLKWLIYSYNYIRRIFFIQLIFLVLLLFQWPSSTAERNWSPCSNSFNVINMRWERISISNFFEITLSVQEPTLDVRIWRL